MSENIMPPEVTEAGAKLGRLLTEYIPDDTERAIVHSAIFDYVTLLIKAIPEIDEGGNG